MDLLENPINVDVIRFSSFSFSSDHLDLIEFLEVVLLVLLFIFEVTLMSTLLLIPEPY